MYYSYDVKVDTCMAIPHFIMRLEEQNNLPFVLARFQTNSCDTNRDGPTSKARYSFMVCFCHRTSAGRQRRHKDWIRREIGYVQCLRKGAVGWNMRCVTILNPNTFGEN